jgi:hypothetical protein
MGRSLKLKVKHIIIAFFSRERIAPAKKRAKVQKIMDIHKKKQRKLYFFSACWRISVDEISK